MSPQIPEITIAAVPKAFTGQNVRPQRNAIQSWLAVNPRPEIILLGDDERVEQTAREFGLRHIGGLQTNKYGTPLVNDIFEKVRRAASNDIILYINSDIILLDGLMEAAADIQQQFDEFLIIGKRRNLDLEPDFELAGDWKQRLQARAAGSAQLSSPRAIDYFLFRGDLWPDMPPFALGRFAWDNWLVYAASLRCEVIDATEKIHIIHQNHDYLIDNKRMNKSQSWRSAEARTNREMAGEIVRFGFGATDQASLRYENGSLDRCRTVESMSRLEELYIHAIEKNWGSKLSRYTPLFETAEVNRRAQRPLLSIVIVSCRSHPDIVNCLKILKSCANDTVEILFVDNGSHPPLQNMVSGLCDVYIRLRENCGAYMSRNIGSLYARAGTLLFLDDDCIPDPGITAEYIRLFDTYDIISARGPVLLKSPPTDELKLGYHCYYGQTEFPIYACKEGNSAYNAGLFFRVGGWDDDIRFGHGGVDLSLRLMRLDPDMRKQMYSFRPVIYHDPPVGDAWKAKREKNILSRERLLKIHPDFDLLDTAYKNYFGRRDLLIPKKAESPVTACDPAAHNYFRRNEVAHLYGPACIEKLFTSVLNAMQEASRHLEQENIPIARSICEKSLLTVNHILAIDPQNAQAAETAAQLEAFVSRFPRPAAVPLARRTPQNQPPRKNELPSPEPPLQSESFNPAACSYIVGAKFSRIYHYHVRKTGGTSLNHMFMSLGGHDGRHIYDALCEMPSPKILLSGDKVYSAWDKDVLEQGRYFYAHAHIPHHKIQLPSGTFTVTVLRDPVARLLSHYKMLRELRDSNSPHPGLLREGPWLGNSFTDFLGNVQRDVLHNQLFMFSPDYNPNQALENILSCSHCFLTENFDEGITQLSLKLDMPLFPRHVRRSRLPVEFSDADLNRLRNMLEPEIHLYEALQKIAGRPLEKTCLPQDLRLARLGSEYGGWVVAPELIPFGSTVISAGVGEDITFDAMLMEHKKCAVVGIDPTPKAREYAAGHSPRAFTFLNRALWHEDNREILMFKNKNPEHVSESVLSTHNGISNADSYPARTIAIETVLQKFRNVSVLKMDVEGAEYEVLPRLRALTVPQLCVEFHHFCSDRTIDDTRNCIAHLQRLGYTYIYDANKGRPLTEVTFIHETCIRKPAARPSQSQPDLLRV